MKRTYFPIVLCSLAILFAAVYLLVGRPTCYGYYTNFRGFNACIVENFPIGTELDALENNLAKLGYSVSDSKQSFMSSTKAEKSVLKLIYTQSTFGKSELKEDDFGIYAALSKSYGLANSKNHFLVITQNSVIVEYLFYTRK